MKKIIIVLFLTILSNQTFSSKLDDIQTRLDDMEWDQMMRDNQRQFEQDMRNLKKERNRGNNQTKIDPEDTNAFNKFKVLDDPKGYQFLGEDSGEYFFISTLSLNKLPNNQHLVSAFTYTTDKSFYSKNGYDNSVIVGYVKCNERKIDLNISTVHRVKFINSINLKRNFNEVKYKPLKNMISYLCN